MTSKEALKDISYLILQEVDNLKYKDLWKEALNTIKQDLERLEMLEKNSDKVVKDSVKLINKNLFLQQENKKLNFENQALRKGIDLDLNAKLLSENKKLEKVIEILKSYNLKVSYIPNITRPHLSLNDYGDGVSLDIEEYELLKEVLGDANN